MTHGLQLIGADTRLPSTRTVMLNGVELGEVIPVSKVTHQTWEARDTQGRCHGDHWLTAWHAAEALCAALDEPIDPPGWEGGFASNH